MADEQKQITPAWFLDKGVTITIMCVAAWWMAANYIQPDLEEKRENARQFRKAVDLLGEQSKSQTEAMNRQSHAIEAVQRGQEEQSAMMRKFIETQERLLRATETGAWNKPRPSALGTAAKSDEHPAPN